MSWTDTIMILSSTENQKMEEKEMLFDEIIRTLEVGKSNTTERKNGITYSITYCDNHIFNQPEKEKFKEKVNAAAFADQENNSVHSAEFYRQISQLADDLYDCIKEILEKIMSKCEEKYIVEEIFSSYDAIVLVDASDYDSGNYDYERQSKAKVSCKEAVKRALDDIHRNFKEGQDIVIDNCKDFLNDMDNDIQEFIREFQESYDDYVSLDCDSEAEAYAVSRKRNVADKQKLSDIYTDLNAKEAFAILLKGMFEEPVSELLHVQKYFAACKYDEDGDGYYCYDMDDAISGLNEDFEELYESAHENLEKKVMDLYGSLLNEFASNIAENLIGLFQTEDI